MLGLQLNRLPKRSVVALTVLLIFIISILSAHSGRAKDQHLIRAIQANPSIRAFPISINQRNASEPGNHDLNTIFRILTIPAHQEQSPKRAEIVGSQAQQKKRNFNRTGKDYALLIATDEYDHWGRLSNPLGDANAIADALREYYGFESPEVIMNPTKRQARDAILRYKREKKYSDQDQLFIFIAGHGTYLDEWKQGFIVFRDSEKVGDDDLGESYISHRWLKDTIDLIDCKHILLVIDSCFSGTIDDAIVKRGEEGEYKDTTNPIFIERNMRWTTRRYVTSGGKEYVPDGRPGQHSPFARKLLEALRNGGGQDGILTITGLLFYMERVTPEVHQNGWGKDEPGSNFLFIAKSK
jgi:hypothetical protein